MVTRRFILLTCVLAAFALASAGCDDTTLDQILGTDDDADLPPGYVQYELQERDYPYSVAKRFYGKGWKVYKIREANPEVFEDYDNEWVAGTKILLPPDRGRSVDSKLPEDYR